MLRRSRNSSVRWIVSRIIQCNIKCQMLMCSSSMGHDSIFNYYTHAGYKTISRLSMYERMQSNEREVTLHIIRELGKLWLAWHQNDDLPSTNYDLHINLCMCPTNDGLKGWTVTLAPPPNSITRLHSSLVKAQLSCSLLWHPNPDPIVGLGMCECIHDFTRCQHLYMAHVPNTNSFGTQSLPLAISRVSFAECYTPQRVRWVYKGLYRVQLHSANGGSPVVIHH